MNDIYNKKFIIETLEIDYFDKSINEIEKYIDDGYKLIGIDPGFKNLITACDEENNKMLYTISQYNIESRRKKYKNRIQNWETEITNKTITKAGYKKYKKIRGYINSHQNKSFQYLQTKIFKKYGKKCILLFGDCGYNQFNYNLLKFLSKQKSPIYLVNEFLTSKLCPICRKTLQNMYRTDKKNKVARIDVVTPDKNKLIRGLKYCKNCNIMFNRDSVACKNIINKVKRLLV